MLAIWAALTWTQIGVGAGATVAAAKAGSVAIDKMTSTGNKEIDKHRKQICVSDSSIKTALKSRDNFILSNDNFIKYVENIVKKIDNNIKLLKGATTDTEKKEKLQYSEKELKELHETFSIIQTFHEFSYEDSTDPLSTFYKAVRLYRNDLNSGKESTLKSNDDYRWENLWFPTKWTKGLFWNEKSWNESMDKSEIAIKNCFNLLLTEFNKKISKNSAIINEINKIVIYSRKEGGTYQDNFITHSTTIQNTLLKLKQALGQ